MPLTNSIISIWRVHLKPIGQMRNYFQHIMHCSLHLKISFFDENHSKRIVSYPLFSDLLSSSQSIWTGDDGCGGSCLLRRWIINDLVHHETMKLSLVQSKFTNIGLRELLTASAAFTKIHLVAFFSVVWKSKSRQWTHFWGNITTSKNFRASG